jgi:hypothetical protein
VDACRNAAADFVPVRTFAGENIVLRGIAATQRSAAGR